MTLLSCVYEDQHIYAIQKPEGVPFHNMDLIHKDADASLAPYQEGIVELAKRFLNDEHIFPVHRLDMMTSGLMVFARHAQANREISMALEHKTLEKYYLALSIDKPKKKQGAVIGDMLKARSGSYKLNRSSEHPAITRFFARQIRLNKEDKAWFFALKPETGKTHQLRVALKSLGSPILGDQRYGGAAASRAYLHAYRMRFDLFGKRYSLCAPDFTGEEFSLAAFAASERSENASQFLSPETFAWPKAAFKLGD